MIAALSAFMLAAYLPQLFPSWLLIGLVIANLLGLGAALRCGSVTFTRWAKVVTCFVIALCWASGYGHWQLKHRLAPELEGQALSLPLIIAGLPLRVGLRCSYDAIPLAEQWSAALSNAGLNPELAKPRRLRLNDYRCSELPQPGERWLLSVRLKRPHGYRNPGGYDRELQLLREGIDATGSVQRRPPPVRLPWADQNHPERGLDAWRWQFTESLNTLLSDNAGMVNALLLGDRRGLSEGQWQRLRDSGTLHLFVVSGMHIGSVAMAVYAVVFGLLRLLSRSRLLPRQWLALCCGLSAATLYAAMAGWAIPTQRALLMVAALMLGWLSSRRLSYPRRLGWAALLVLLIDPLALRSIGFWLSFAAAAILLYAFACRPHVAATKRLIYAQWAVFIGLAPWLVTGFSQVALLAPLINLVAIPWVTLVVLPVLLMGALLLPVAPALAKPVLELGGWTLSLFDRLLQQLQPWLVTLDLPAPSPWAIPLAVIGTGVLLAPRMLPRRWLALPLLLPLFWVRPDRLAPGEYAVTVFDVGQGSAVLVETANHRLLYDSAPRYPSGFVVAQMTLLPYLQQRGIRRLDKLIGSHGDSDHVGGHELVLSKLEVDQQLSGEPERIAGDACRAGQTWVWDGVRFRLLHPPDQPHAVDRRSIYRGNNSSCVLMIESESGGTLLTGDIESAVEQDLVRRYGDGLRADLLIASHHGSKGASSPIFVQTVQPRSVVFSSGYRNRYGHPAEAVVSRFLAIKAEILQTQQSGAERWRFSTNGMAIWPLWSFWQRGYWRLDQ